MKLAESNKKIKCYLSPAALRALSILESAGMDQDLAMSMLEKLLEDTDMYEVPDNE